mmetsp:Transcript_50591/g.118652  ORF Transcript_50591/g.118652 Transcript_50591/m.118652 type:complete len:89 (-) Transcript_50591:183-449(-)
MVSTSRLFVGSSNTSKWGSVTQILAMATRDFCPPDKFRMHCVARSPLMPKRPKRPRSSSSVGSDPSNFRISARAQRSRLNWSRWCCVK